MSPAASGRVLWLRGCLAALTAAGTFAVAGCGGATDPNAAGDTSAPAATPTAATQSPTAAPTTTTNTPPAVPDSLRFTATTVDGAPFDAASLAGKPVVLWFWAAWCPKCRAAAGNVAAVQRDYAGRVHVVGVAGLGSGTGEMRDFVAKRGIGGFANLSDDAGAVWRRFQVTTQEYYVVLDANGIVVHKGPLTSQGLRDKVATLAG